MSNEIMGNGLNIFDPQVFNTMQRVARFWASSDLVPQNYHADIKPIPAGATPEQVKIIAANNESAVTKAIANCMVAIDMSIRIGASPLMVMQNMTVIYGKPSWASKFLIATVNSCGRFDSLQFKFKDKGALGMVDYTDYVWNGRTKTAVNKQFDGREIHNIECVAFTSPKGKSDVVLTSSVVSIKMAVQEGWYTKNGSKWRTMPNQMLMYRAASMWTNVYAPELSMGIRTTEELQDIEDITNTAVEIKDDKGSLENKRAVSIDLDKSEKAPESNEQATDGEKPAEAEKVPEKAPEGGKNATAGGSSAHDAQGSINFSEPEGINPGF